MQNVTESAVWPAQEGERLFRPQRVERLHHQLSQSLPVGLDAILVQPQVKHISLNISHSPPTFPHCLIIDSAKYPNPAQLLRPGDNENRLFFPHLTQQMGGSCCGEERRKLHTTGFTAWNHRQYLCRKSLQINLNYMDLTKHY